MSSRVAIGLGSNLGDRVQNIIDARHCLRASDACLNLRCSSLYYSSPLGYLQQPAFVNCVVLLDVSSPLSALLEVTQDCEQRMGRQRDPANRNAPRIIDIDVLLSDQPAIDTPDLQVPHPRMVERLFVLQPLLELWPDATLPDGSSVAQVLAEGQRRNRFEGQQLYRLGRG